MLVTANIIGVAHPFEVETQEKGVAIIGVRNFYAPLHGCVNGPAGVGPLWYPNPPTLAETRFHTLTVVIEGDYSRVCTIDGNYPFSVTTKYW